MKIMLKCKTVSLLPVTFLLILSSTLSAHPKVDPRIVDTGVRREEAKITREKTKSIGNPKVKRNHIETKTGCKETINNLSNDSIYLLGKNGNTMDINISNPRKEGNYFKFEIQIKRTNTWESGMLENVLGNADFYFDRNANAFAGSPSYENSHSDLTGNNYTCTAQVNEGKLQFKIEYSLQDLNFFKPAIDVYNTVCTMVWEIEDPTENTGVPWDQMNTGALTAANNAINLTYYGSGDITFPNAPVITALEDTSMLEDDTLQIALSATDVNGGSLTFSAASDTSSVNLSISDTTLTIIPEPNWDGLANIEVTVSNGELSDTTNFILTVQAVNDAPVTFLLLTPSDGMNIILTSDNQNDTLIISWETANDVDGDTIIYSFFSEDTLSLLNIEDTKETEIRLPYADIQAILDENDLSLMRGSWTIIASDGQDSTEASNSRVELTIETTLTGIDDGNNLPKEFALHSNYPNPFNPVTTISYDLPKNSQVALVVYNMLGREVVKLVDHNQVAGRYTVHWNGQDTFGRQVSSGLYFYLIIADEFIKTRRMLLLK